MELEDLDDMAICFRLAQIMGYKPTHEHCHIYGKWVNSHANKLHGALGTIGDFNPLKDDALCFRLMDKFNVLRELTGTEQYRAVICNWGKGSEYIRETGDTLNKAICLVIIKAHEQLTPA